MIYLSRPTLIGQLRLRGLVSTFSLAVIIGPPNLSKHTYVGVTKWARLLMLAGVCRRRRL